MAKKYHRKRSVKRHGKSAMYKMQPYRPATSIPRTPTLLKKVGYANFKLHYLKDIFTDEASFTLKYNWSRMDYANLNGLEVMGFNLSPVWPRIKFMFEEYAITGMRIQYIPSNLAGLTDSTLAKKGVMTQLILFEDLNTYDITTKTTQEQLGYDSYQVFDPTRTFTLYRDNKALTKSQNS